MGSDFFIKGKLKTTMMAWNIGQVLLQELNKGKFKNVFFPIICSGPKCEHYVKGIGLNSGPWIMENKEILNIFKMLFDVLDTMEIDIHGVLLIVGEEENDTRIVQVTQRWENEYGKERQLRKHIEIFESKMKNYNRYHDKGYIAETGFAQNQSLPPIYDEIKRSDDYDDIIDNIEGSDLEYNK